MGKVAYSSHSIVIKKAPPSNPAILMPEYEEDFIQDCVDMVTTMAKASHTWETLLQNHYLLLYTDGSSMIEGGDRYAEWEVATEKEVIASGIMPKSTLPQQAEHKAMTEACKFTGEANVYTDSWCD